MLKLVGKYELTVKRKGKIVVYDSGENLVTSDGEELAAGRFAPTTPPTAIDWLALGSDATIPLKSNTQLASEIAGTRTASTTDVVTANQLTYTFQYTHSGANITVREAGTFNNAGAGLGTMACRFLTLEFTMNSGDVLDLTWTLTFSGVD